MGSIEPQSTKIFTSNTKPIRITLQGVNESQQLKVIYKYSDDMRLDQLIMQIVSIMDQLLRELNVDLKLTKYKLLVFSSEDGLIEFVENSQTIQNVLQTCDEEMLIYLKRLSVHYQDCEELILETEEEQVLNHISKEVFYNYMESLSSYSVITFLLGIGDRHLENLLIQNDGRLFHIDFGYALGEDPKFLPMPHFKIIKNMYRVFAG